MSFIVEETGIEPRVIRRQPSSRVHLFHINGRDAVKVDEWIHADSDLGLARKRLVPEVAT